MDILLVMAILVFVLAALGLTGVVEILRPGAWLILVAGVMLLLLHVIL